MELTTVSSETVYTMRDLTSNSTPGNSTTSSPVPSDADYYFVWVYVSPWILLIGVVGNILTLLVMTRRRMRGSSTCVYLSAIAVADSLALLFRIPPEFFEAAGIVIFKDLSRWTCKVEKFSFYTASDVAIWILVAFTVDRLIAVALPLIKYNVCPPRRAASICVMVVVVAIGKNLHVFWTRGVVKLSDGHVMVCGRPEPYTYFEQHVRPWLAFVLVSALPFIVISVCNCLIIYALLRAHRQRTVALQRSATMTDNDKPEDTSAQAQPMQSRRAVFTQTSLMCIAASLAFVICVTPSIVLTMGRHSWKFAGGVTQTVYFASRAVVHQLSCLNHAVNFFLYCITGQRFRTELMALMRRERSSVSAFEASTRRYYLEQAARRTTQTSTSTLAMQTVSLTLPVIADQLDDDCLSDGANSYR